MKSRFEVYSYGRQRPKWPVLVMGDSWAVGLGNYMESALKFQSKVHVEAKIGERPERTRELVGRRLSTFEANSVVLSTSLNGCEDKQPGEIVDIIIEITDAIRDSHKEVILVTPPPACALPQFAEMARELRTWYLKEAWCVDSWELIGNVDTGTYRAPFGAPDKLHARWQGYKRVSLHIFDILDGKIEPRDNTAKLGSESECSCGARDWDVSATAIQCKVCGRIWGLVNGVWKYDTTSSPYVLK